MLLVNSQGMGVSIRCDMLQVSCCRLWWHLHFANRVCWCIVLKWWTHGCRCQQIDGRISLQWCCKKWITWDLVIVLFCTRSHNCIEALVDDLILRKWTFSPIFQKVTWPICHCILGSLSFHFYHQILRYLCWLLLLSRTSKYLVFLCN